MRALTMDELDFVSGGWNPYSNPTDPNSWDPSARTPDQKAYDAQVRMDARQAVQDKMAADLAGLLGGELAGRVAGWVVGTLGGNPLTVVASGEITSQAVEPYITEGTRKVIQNVRAFYIHMYYSILDRYGVPR